ncbi:MAG: glycosyltransferase family 4 protein [Candidatus Portnoybacteria bacterium]|nr:glycosyltransferase family 4 protein [Candidatus Portnoybacteria bacterium]
MRTKNIKSFKGIRIGIDARLYGPKQTGPGRYVQKLIQNLEKIDSNNQYIIFLRKENWNEYQPKNKNFKKVLADCHWYTLKEQILMPFKIRQAKVDLMHFPHFNVPVFCFKPFVVTIHDLILKRFPTRRVSALEPFSYWFKNIAYHLVIYSAIKRSKKIIAISNYTKKDILKYFSIDSKKIKVIYEGAPQEIFNSSNDNILKKHNISKPYLLYVGNAYPHKNLERLIMAFDGLNKNGMQLVLAGRLDFFYKKIQKRFSGFKNIVFTDFILDKDLPTLYQNASLYIFPSLCEGFGLPPLEAMTYQIPVVSSKATCLPEILGQAAIYFNPEDIEDMKQKIKLVLEDKQLQKELILEGNKKIREYSWVKMAQEVLREYEA